MKMERVSKRHRIQIERERERRREHLRPTRTMVMQYKLTAFVATGRGTGEEDINDVVH